MIGDQTVRYFKVEMGKRWKGRVMQGRGGKWFVLTKRDKKIISKVENNKILVCVDSESFIYEEG